MRKITLQKILLLCLLWSVLFFFQLIGNSCAEQPRVARQVSGRVIFGPFEFYPPQGYWYGPVQFPQKGLKIGELFRVTFLETDEDMSMTPDPSFKVVFNVVISVNNLFKDLSSYREYILSHIDDESRDKDLPETTKALFGKLPNWFCRENTSEGHPPPLVALHCATVGKYIVLMSAIAFDEKKVLEKARMLADMMSSLKESENK
jgi:hypothetical protein